MKWVRWQILIMALGAVIITGTAIYQINPEWLGWVMSQIDSPLNPSVADEVSSAGAPEESGTPNETRDMIAEKLPPKTYQTGETMGMLEIEKLDLKMQIVEGTGEKELMAGLGHVKGTAGLGETGNSAIAGHRNYIKMHPFKYLDQMAAGDKIVVKTDSAEFIYTVYQIFVVEPKDVWVLQPVENEKTLTLITCHPYLNPTKRLIVQARMQE